VLTSHLQKLMQMCHLWACPSV